MKKFIALILCVVLMFSLSGCLLALLAPEEEPEKVGTVEPTPIVIKPDPTKAPDGDVTLSANVSQESFTVGDVVEGTVSRISFLSFEESMGKDFYEPEEGSIFVICEFEVENISSEEIYVSTLSSFTSFCDGYSIDTDFWAEESTGKGSLSGTLMPGKKAYGVVGYQVPKDWSELELYYEEDIFEESNILFVINK